MAPYLFDNRVLSVATKMSRWNLDPFWSAINYPPGSVIQEHAYASKDQDPNPQNWFFFFLVLASNQWHSMIDSDAAPDRSQRVPTFFKKLKNVEK